MKPAVKRYDAIIVGAGPAGMMAALTAAERGLRRIALLEAQDEAGRKLLATGGGRCNLTNTLSTEEFMARLGRNGRFMAPALRGMDSKELRAFFAKRGVPTHVVDGFHVFPVSESARDIRDTLFQACLRAGVEIHLATPVRHLILSEGAIEGVCTEGGEVLRTHHLLLATGGAASPALGGSFSGYTLAEEAGHTIRPPLPALTPIPVRERWISASAGVVLSEAELLLRSGNKTVRRERGSLLFTHQGLSGPPALNLSADVMEAAEKGKEMALILEPYPERRTEGWHARLVEGRKRHGAKQIENFLDQDFPHSFAETLATIAGIHGRLLASLSSREEERLVELLSKIVLHPAVERMDFSHAMATRGGVRLCEVDPDTLESRRLRGLYFAGEILDLDGPCGGFHLQWAFSSGRLAGLAMTRDRNQANAS